MPDDAMDLVRPRETVRATLAHQHLDLGDATGALALLSVAAHETATELAVAGMAFLAQKRAVEARDVLLRAVALGDPSGATLLNLALAEAATGATERALARVAEAELAAPGWAEPPLRRAEILRRAGDKVGAEAAYEATLARDPARPEALIGLAALTIARGDGARAQMLLLQACAVAPERADAWDALGLALALTGDLVAAESAFGEATRLEPEAVPWALHRAEAAVAAGDGEAELARLEREPAGAVAPLAARGVVLDHLGRRTEAVDLLEAAAILAPDSALIARVRADLLTRTLDARGAVAAIERARELDPASVELRNNLGAALLRAQLPSRARGVLEELAAEVGASPEYLCNLANARVACGDQEGGLAAARDAVAMASDAPIAWRALANALVYHPSATGAALCEATSRGAALLRAPAPPALANSREPGRRLRLGLLSATLKTHPVGWLTMAGLESLDPTAFEIVAFSQPRPAHPDMMARRFAALAGDWVVVDSDTPAARAARIRAHGIDILLDLGGHGDQGWVATCAWRAAPVQIKWVGAQSHTTGIAEVDWFLTDRWESPPGTEGQHAEKLLRMPDGYCCYSPPPYAPDVAPLPALRNGFVTFGCFNNLAKITPEVVRTWARILAATPASRLLLKTPQFDDGDLAAMMIARFAAHGIPPSRLELRGASVHRALLEQYADVDIALDPFPYTGGLTTCEALWMGVPVITRPGDYFASRHSASHIANVGLTSWIAPDLAAYETLAVERAHDLTALTGLRAGLRQRVAASPLCDAPRFGRNLGRALRQAWETWCRENHNA